MPAGPVPSQPQSPGGSGRDEQFYYPGSWNFQFLAQFPSGARLFNAFDYGHAVLYEKLFTVRDSAELAQALEHEYQYLTTDLLQRPPRYAVAEEAIEPDYAKLAWQAKQMFDWAHLLHRQIYDIYADPRIPLDAYRPTFVQSLVMVPIRTLDPIGAIGNYWASRHRSSPEEVYLLRALADSTSLAMENVRMFEELGPLALREGS